MTLDGEDDFDNNPSDIVSQESKLVMDKGTSNQIKMVLDQHKLNMAFLHFSKLEHTKDTAQL